MTDDPVFDRAVSRILEREEGWPREAYEFIREAVEYTIAKASEAGPIGHVAGPEIVEGAKELAIREYGAMAAWTLAKWQITETGDVGKLIFALIGEGQLSASENDSLEDFADLFNLPNALAEPFRPRGDKIEVEILG